MRRLVPELLSAAVVLTAGVIILQMAALLATVLYYAAWKLLN